MHGGILNVALTQNCSALIQGLSKKVDQVNRVFKLCLNLQLKTCTMLLAIKRLLV